MNIWIENLLKHLITTTSFKDIVVNDVILIAIKNTFIILNTVTILHVYNL